MERSFGIMNNQNMSAELASDRYIELEHKYNELGEKLKAEANYKKQKPLRRKRKAIRAEQNMLYPYMVGTGYVKFTEQVLGFKQGYQTMYERYKRSRK